MATRYQAGDFKYEHVEGWGQLPEGWRWGQVGAVGVDSKDRVHVFTRTEHPYMLFDKAGKLEWSWGTGIFEDAHGICITPDDTIYLVDRDPDTRKMYAEYLRLSAACETDEAEDGREALAKAMSRHPDVIVTETRLPGINGFDLCTLLRRDTSTSAIPSRLPGGRNVVSVA